VRTTLTLEDDVADRLRLEMQNSGKSFKQLVNEYIRLALNAKLQPGKDEPFQVRSFEMGSMAGINYDNIGEVLEQLEGPLHP
jgi:hypothetical protein